MAQSVVINGTTYENVPEVVIPKPNNGGDATFYDTSADDATQADVLSGKTFHTSSGGKSGNMYNNGAVSGAIDYQNYANGYTIPQGYHNGSGTVNIASSEKAKIISGNIKSGVTIFGVQGDGNVIDTTLSSSVAAGSANIVYGKDAYVNGSIVHGSLTTISVSQDSTTKVLTIS